MKLVVGIAEVVPKMVTDKLLKFVFVLPKPVQIVCGEDLRDSAASLTLPNFFDTFLFTPKRSFVSPIFYHVFLIHMTCFAQRSF